MNFSLVFYLMENECYFLYLFLIKEVVFEWMNINLYYMFQFLSHWIKNDCYHNTNYWSIYSTYHLKSNLWNKKNYLGEYETDIVFNFGEWILRDKFILYFYIKFFLSFKWQLIFGFKVSWGSGDFDILYWISFEYSYLLNLKRNILNFFNKSLIGICEILFILVIIWTFIVFQCSYLEVSICNK